MELEEGEERAVSHERKCKILDDQTIDVPAAFDRWKQKEGIVW